MVFPIMTAVHLILICGISLFAAWSIKEGKISPKFRSLAALEAIPEMIGRCVEMNRPLIYTVGMAELRTGYGMGSALPGFAIFGEVMSQSIDMGAEVLVIVNTPEHIPIMTSLMEDAFLLKGKEDEMDPDNIVFLGGGRFTQISGILSHMDKMKPGAFLFPGGCSSGDIIMYGEHATRLGALSMSGMTNTWCWPFLVSTYDYWLLGEDILAAGSILSDNPLLSSTVWSGDIYRYFLVAILLISVIATWAGVNVGGFFTV